MHIFHKFKIMTGQNRIGNDLKIKITEEIEPKKARFGVFCFAEKSSRAERPLGRWGGGGGEREGVLRGGM